MAIYRDALGNIDRQEFEKHLRAVVRKEGYIEIIMFTPDQSIPTATITSTDVLTMNNIPICDLSTINDLNKYTSSTIATLEENLWLLNGRFIVYQGGTLNGYISNSVSNSNGEFSTKPTMTVQLAHPSDIENFSVILNAAVPTGYPKDIKIYCYDDTDTLIGNPITVDVEWEEATGEVDENNQPIYKKVLLDSLPSVNFEINKTGVDHLVIEYGNTRFRNRRIRVSSLLFGKTVVLTDDNVLNVDYTDKTSYVCDTLPSRIFRFDVNNYNGIYDVDNPNNGYINLDKKTIVRFRNGYNVCGYQYDNTGHVMTQLDYDTNGNSIPGTEHPVIDLNQDGVEIEWDNWKELRLIDVSANADESATFTCGSLLDIMTDTYTKDIYTGSIRTTQEIVEDILTFEELDINSVEWSSDGILKPTYDGNNQLLPYSQWTDTYYSAYKINTPIPEIECRQVMQLLAFSMGATILIKDNGKIKFANLNINDSTSFTNSYTWNYRDFETIPAAEPLENISKLEDLSLPKYYSYLDYSGGEQITVDGSVYSNCTVVSTINCNTANTETTYTECLPIGCRKKNGDPFQGTIAYTELYSKRGIINLGGFATGDEVSIEILGYPIHTKQLQERNVTSNTLVLDTKIMYEDIDKYNSNGTIAQTEQIKRKYLDWYKTKFKYRFSTRGEPLVNAGDYGIIQTQFTGQMPVYILQNHWTFDGSWSGDMEVIALD